MTSIMFRALNELNSYIIVVDKLLKTSSTAYFSKCAHRIKNMNMLNMSLLLLLYITHLVAYQCNQLHARAKQSNSAVTITTNKMDAQNKTIDSKSTGSGGIHRLMYHTSYDVS